MKYILLFLLLIVVGCQVNDDAYPVITDHVLLRALYEDDQEARNNITLGARITPEEVAAFARADSLRRVQVDSVVALGELLSANDYYHAAMIYQHGGDSLFYSKAYEMSSKAVELDSTHKEAKWLSAASWDRYLISIGKPQWYGTQFTFNQEIGRYALGEIDTTRVDDVERERMGVRTLKEARAYADSLNAQLSQAQLANPE